MEPQHTELDVEWTGSAHEILAQCSALDEADKAAEDKARQFHTLGIFALVLGGVGMLVLSGGGLGFVSLAVGVGVGIWGFARAHAVSSTADIEDRKLDIARDTVRTFAPELHAKRPLSVRIDFRSYCMSLGEAQGEHRWLVMRLPLLDGSQLEVSASTRYKRKTRPKRKYTKIKDKLSDVLVCEIIAPRAQHFDPRVEARIPRLGLASRLHLTKVMVAPRKAKFIFRGHPGLLVYGHGGWVGSYGQLTAGSVVQAMICSYRVLAGSMRVDASTGTGAGTPAGSP